MIQYLRNCLEAGLPKNRRELTSTANKKVLITRFERDSIHGFVQTPGSFGPSSLDLLTPSGNLVKVPYGEIKAVCFVRDFETAESWRAQRSFASRPKTPGLWIRLIFRDEDTTEGVMPNNLALLDPTGFTLIPPDPTMQNQRLFVPRQALREVVVLGVVGIRPPKPRGPKPQTGRKSDEEQLEMFS